MSVPDAVVAVVTHRNRVLVVRRGPAVRRPGYWTPVSGAVEPGESQAETVVREVAEEVGLAVAPLVKVWECDTDDGSFRLHWWTAAVTGGALRPDPAEVSEARWITPDRFGELHPTFAAHRHFFTEVLPTLGEASPDASGEG